MSHSIGAPKAPSQSGAALLHLAGCAAGLLGIWLVMGATKTAPLGQGSTTPGRATRRLAVVRVPNEHELALVIVCSCLSLPLQHAGSDAGNARACPRAAFSTVAPYEQDGGGVWPQEEAAATSRPPASEKERALLGKVCSVVGGGGRRDGAWEGARRRLESSRGSRQHKRGHAASSAVLFFLFCFVGCAIVRLGKMYIP